MRQGGRPGTRAAAAAVLVSVLLASLVGRVGTVSAYDQETHLEIATIATERSDLDQILRDRYGLPAGILTIVNGKRVREWITDGAKLEDSPFPRVLNHFHNPLQPWSQAGLFPGQSSVLWQQNPNQGSESLGGTWSWPFARQRFRDFLTAPTQAARDTALAETARALGQLSHMIQDATVPAHARNDPHLPVIDSDGYEGRTDEMRRSPDPTVRARFDAFLAAPPVVPSLSILSATEDPQAPVPIARLIDSETYGGMLASYSTGGAIGAAEYTNGGYVSDDTIFRDFALPRRESLESVGFLDPDPLTDAGAAGTRRYFSKIGDGDLVSHFVAEGSLWEQMRFHGPLFVLFCEACYILDDKTYEAAAARLIPRAVGYSAALLNYFFRGRFEVAQDVQGTQRSLRITNRMPGEALNGTFELRYDTADGTRVPLGSWGPLALGPDATTDPLPVPAYPAGQAPAGRHLLIFRGTLGAEQDQAVAAMVLAVPVVYAVVVRVTSVQGAPQTCEVRAAGFGTAENAVSGIGSQAVDETQDFSVPSSVYDQMLVYFDPQGRLPATVMVTVTDYADVPAGGGDLDVDLGSAPGMSLSTFQANPCGTVIHVGAGGGFVTASGSYAYPVPGTLATGAPFFVVVTAEPGGTLGPGEHIRSVTGRVTTTTLSLQP